VRARPVVVAAAVAVVLLLLAGAYLVLRPDAKSSVSPLPPEQARPSAERACVLMRQFESQVISNAQAKVALATLDEALQLSDRAYRGDVVWVRLNSGIRAVKKGFDKNDGPATQIGIRVVRDACSEFAPATPGP
jgi:hypothetical protein